MELFQPFLGCFLPLFQLLAAAKILFFPETTLFNKNIFSKYHQSKQFPILSGSTYQQRQNIIPLLPHNKITACNIVVYVWQSSIHILNPSPRRVSRWMEASLAKYRRKLYRIFLHHFYIKIWKVKMI